MKARLGRRGGTAAFIAGLVVISALLVYAAYAQETVQGPGTTVPRDATIITPPGYSCGDASLSQTVRQMERSAGFAQLSHDLCYNYIGETNATAGSMGPADYVFNYYNGTIFYPCGTSPSELVVSQIRAVPGPGGYLFRFSNDTVALDSPDCASGRSPIGVVSANIVGVTIPAVPELNLTLSTSYAPQPVTSLTATILTPVGQEVEVVFADATFSHPILVGSVASQLELIGAHATIAAGGVYSMSIQGSYENGEEFSYSVEVAFVNA